MQGWKEKKEPSLQPLHTRWPEAKERTPAPCLVVQKPKMQNK